MEEILSKQIKSTPSSFIRNIFKTVSDPDIISFAGGLPNPLSFPSEELKVSSARIIDKYGSKVFQYSQTPGLIELRDVIAQRYNKKFNLDLTYENILITTGSQQALDLISKATINEGDGVIVEKPTFLGALQVFSQYRPTFNPVTLEEYGLNLEELKEQIKKQNKLMYVIPDFQNPTGLTYSKENKHEIRNLIKNEKFVLIEDDPYGELRFEDEHEPYIGLSTMDYSVVLGSFSKTITPGMRLGFVISKHKELLSKISLAKEASDLHTNIFSQYLIYDYLVNNDLDEHILKIRKLYKKQKDAMINAMEKYFPKEVKYTNPKGGMFLWVTLPSYISALSIFDKAVKKKVTFVPGDPFYTQDVKKNTMRLNYTNADTETIDIGIKRLAELLKEVL